MKSAGVGNRREGTQSKWSANRTSKLKGMESGGTAPFLTKIYAMVDDPSTDSLVTWGAANNSFIVTNPYRFSQSLLPRYFKHRNFSSFVRQLNTYGFRKVDPDRWEFAHEAFLRGQKQLLGGIHRRRSHLPQRQGNGMPCATELGKLRLEMEMAKLKRDKEAILLDLRELKQQQAAADREIQLMNRRLQVTEQRPQQIASFLAQVIENPALLVRMVEQREIKQLPGDRKKRRLPSNEQELPTSGELSVSGLLVDEETAEHPNRASPDDSAGGALERHSGCKIEVPSSSNNPTASSESDLEVQMSGCSEEGNDIFWKHFFGGGPDLKSEVDDVLFRPLRSSPVEVYTEAGDGTPMDLTPAFLGQTL